MFKHVLSNWSFYILQMLVMMVLSPIMMTHLGEDGLGAWLSIIAGTSLLELLAMGIPMASVRHISEAVAAGDLKRTNTMISTGLGITLALGGVGLVVGLGVFFPLFENELLENDKWAGTPQELLESARIAFLITTVRVAAAIAMRFPGSIFHAKQDFQTNNMIQGAGVIFRALAVVALLYVRPSLEGIAWIFVVETIGVFLAFRYFVHKRFEGLRVGLANFERGHVKELVGFGLIASTLNLGTMIAYNMDALVIGRMIGPDEVTVFDFGNKFFMPIAGLMYGIGAVVMPAATHLKQQKGMHQLKHSFLKWSKVSLSLMLPISLYLYVLGPRFLAAWLDKPEYVFSAGAVTRVLVPSFLIALPLRAVALPILLGTSHPLRATGVFLILAMVNLGLSIALVDQGYGLIGVALGTAIPQTIFAVYILIVTCRELRMGVGRWLVYVVGKAAVGSLPVLAFLLWLEHFVDVRSFPALILSGVAMMGVFAVCWGLFVYRNDPYVNIRAEIAARRR